MRDDDYIYDIQDTNERTLRPVTGTLIAMVAFIADLLILIGVSIWHGIYGLIPDLWATALLQVLSLVAALLLALLLRRPYNQTFHFEKPKGKYISAMLFVFFGIWFIVTAVSMIQAIVAPGLQQETSEEIESQVKSLTIFHSIFIVCLLPAICEEMMFRGVILSATRTYRKMWMRIVLVGALFGIVHMSFVRFLPTAILGAAFAYLTIKTGNMIYACLSHFLNNLISVGFSYLYDALGNAIDAIPTLTPTPQNLATARIMGLGALLSSSEAEVIQYSAGDIVYTIGQILVFAGIGVALTYCGWKRLNNFNLYDPDILIQQRNRTISRRVKIFCITAVAGGILIGIGATAAMTANQIAG